MIRLSPIVYIARHAGRIVDMCADTDGLVDTVASWLSERLTVEMVPEDWALGRIGSTEVWSG